MLLLAPTAVSTSLPLHKTLKLCFYCWIAFFFYTSENQSTLSLPKLFISFTHFQFHLDFRLFFSTVNGLVLCGQKTCVIKHTVSIFSPLFAAFCQNTGPFASDWLDDLPGVFKYNKLKGLARGLVETLGALSQIFVCLF